MKTVKKLFGLALIMCLLFELVPNQEIQAATKPAKPEISVQILKNGTDVKITVNKTEGAKGYKILMKAPADSKYKKVKTLKKSGTVNYTVTGLSEGKYSFKVRAYTKNGKKTVWGSYSKVKTVNIKTNNGTKTQADFSKNDIKEFTIVDGAVTKYTGNGGDVVIPEGVTSIGKNAFKSCDNLISIDIPNGVTSIGDSAFSYCRSLTSVTIPDSVTDIGCNVFKECGCLKNIIIPGSVTNIENLAEDSGLISVTILDGVESIGEYAFGSCRNLTEITIPDSVTSIGYEAFYGCSSLTSIKIPDGVTSIERAFEGCSSLTSIKIPDGITSIGYRAFAECDSLTSITIPGSVTSIGEDAFESCSSLTSIKIPNGVKHIGRWAFVGCSKLNNVTIPDSVTSMGEEVFGDFWGKTITYKGKTYNRDNFEEFYALFE